MSKKFSYDKSIIELEKIVDAIQNGEVGLDKLSTMIHKANELISQCREKLREVDEEINDLTDSE